MKHLTTLPMDQKTQKSHEMVMKEHQLAMKNYKVEFPVQIRICVGRKFQVLGYLHPTPANTPFH
jgi:hypothetical protein